MMYRDNDQDVTARLLAMIGEPYEQPDGCMRFLQRALWEFGVRIDAKVSVDDARLFIPVSKPALGTVVVFKNLFYVTNGYSHREPGFHVGLMLDQRYAIQSSTATFGVGRIEISRQPWWAAVRGFYRPKALCS